MIPEKERFEQIVDYYSGEYKKGLLGKKFPVKLYVYPSHIEGSGFAFIGTDLAAESDLYSIPFLQIRNIYNETIDGITGISIEYAGDSITTDKNKSKIFLPAITEPAKWVHLLSDIQKEIHEKELQTILLQQQREEHEKAQREYKEAESAKFYLDCFNFHIKNTTPQYELYKDKNKIALIYIDENKSLHFLKIDGDAKEEHNGIIPFDKIHYYEKAGNIHYVSEIHGNYSSYGGSVTAGNFSKLATAGGGLLFGMMGMAAGALLSYKPSQSENIQTNFSIDSDTKQIDSRNVMLNFYSDIKKQYIDIELPNDIYNFLQTHLPEKKYTIVLELEKKAAVSQAAKSLGERALLQAQSETAHQQLEDKQGSDSITDFKKKVEKLKIMKEAGLLSDDEFDAEKNKLLKMI